MTTPKKPPVSVKAGDNAAAWSAAVQAQDTAPAMSSADAFAAGVAARDGTKVVKPVVSKTLGPMKTPIPTPIIPPVIKPKQSSEIPFLAGTGAKITTEQFAAARAAADKPKTAAPAEKSNLLGETMSAETIETILAGIRDLSTYTPNVLQNYDNSTYHLRLFQTPDRDVINEFLPPAKDAKTPNNPKTVSEYYSYLDKFQQVTIAESGTTGYNIQGVQIESLVSPNFRSVALNTTSIIMNVVEANGVSFLDALKNSAVQMRLRDMRKCWYFLELTFKGYENDLIESNILADEGLPNGGRWIWQVQITDIETKLSTGGGEYKLTMVPYSETSLDAEARLVPDMMLAEGTTVGELFDDLTTQLNQSWKLRTAANNYLAYNFVFHGVKGRPTVTGDMVRDFSLITADNSLDYIRTLDMAGQGVGGASEPMTPEDAAKIDDKITLKAGERATTAQLITAVRELIPGTRINSGVRTIAQNIAARGKDDSQHLYGTAIDIPRPPNISAQVLQKAFEAKGILVDVIDEKARNHYHIQGSRLKTKAGRHTTPVATPAAKAAPADPNTVPAPPAADTIPISPISGKPRGQFARGTSIDEIVTTVLSCCVEAQQLAKDSDADDASPDNRSDNGSEEGQVNDKGFRESVVFRVEPEVRVLTYDPAFNQYGKSITYHVYGYVTQAPILSRVQINTANKVEVQRGMLAQIAKQGLLKKKYDYLFTGNNLEILSLDIAFNMTWAAVLPMLLRNEAYTAQSRYGADVIKKYTTAVDVIANLGQLEDDIQTQREELNDANAALVGATDEAAKAEALKVALEKKNKLDATVAATDTVRSQVMETRAFLAKKLPQFDRATALSGGRIYAENIDATSLPTLQDMTLAMRYAQDDVKNSVSGGMVGQHHNGKTIFGTVMNQLEGPMTAQMMTLNMKIMGDPYWIGPGNLEQVVRRANDIKTEGSADFTIGDNALTLEFGYPLGTDASDNVVINRSETFTGIYRVTKVSHDFSDGKFTQTIEGVRMPLIDLFKATANTSKDK
jgi:hypothetical protein